MHRVVLSAPLNRSKFYIHQRTFWNLPQLSRLALCVCLWKPCHIMHMCIRHPKSEWSYFRHCSYAIKRLNVNRLPCLPPAACTAFSNFSSLSTMLFAQGHFSKKKNAWSFSWLNLWMYFIPITPWQKKKIVTAVIIITWHYLSRNAALCSQVLHLQRYWCKSCIKILSTALQQRKQRMHLKVRHDGKEGWYEHILILTGNLCIHTMARK